jgi:acetolactate decarboxylase
MSPKDGLYGLGPLSYMRGEILINNGHSYVSFIDKDSSLKVIETDTVSAPFFVYGNNLNWTNQKLPERVTDIASLEKFIKGNIKTDHPFVFKISGRISAAKIHVQNLPKGTKVSSPKEAHTGQRSFELREESVEIIGFYSQHHHGIFTHHDTNLHMHLISADKSKMGHLDALTMRNMTLSIPKSIRVRN